MFCSLARHLPGFGGLSDFDRLTLDEVDLMLANVADHNERIAKALPKPKKGK